MKAEITINKVKVIKEVPTSWDDVTFKMFLALKDCGDDWGKVIAVLTDMDYEIIKKATIKNLDKLLTAVGFINTKTETYIPKTILGYEIPKNLGFETIGQLEDIKLELKAMKEENASMDDQLLKYPLWCAVYACKNWNLKDGETPQYDWKKAEKMQSIFFDAPCLEVLGIGNFTLMKLIGLNLNTGKSSQGRSTLMKKFKQVLTVWRMRLAFMVRSFTWKRKQGLSVKS